MDQTPLNLTAYDDKNDMDVDSHDVTNDYINHDQPSESLTDMTIEELDDDDPALTTSAKIYYPFELEEPTEDDAISDTMSDESSAMLSSDEVSVEAEPDKLARRLSQLQYCDAPEKSVPFNDPLANFPRAHDNWIKRKRRRSTGESLTNERSHRHESKTLARKRARMDVADSLASKSIPCHEQGGILRDASPDRTSR
ncbi:hypothetical protein K461DRAFT_278879 [Myriangium duriaei CBS 260.36]|uniref:Uncharacterized protein n=1 Tax=Myriangium duriaei CBS 260.36 TaxID=1168546 RepID=A0A9P4MFP6_9PEZI|nr:hypothetical protein K461DRAFT_278879 [Myriangium duriaei CBS 260.36]